MHSDVEIGLSAFIGVMVAEALVKPVALHIGRWLLRKADGYIGVIPDWLHNGNP